MANARKGPGSSDCRGELTAWLFGVAAAHTTMLVQPSDADGCCWGSMTVTQRVLAAWFRLIELGFVVVDIVQLSADVRSVLVSLFNRSLAAGPAGDGT